MTQPVRIAYNAVVAKLIDPPEAVKNSVSELLSYDVQGSEFAYSFQTGTWNGRSTFFSHTSCTFPSGFVEMVDERLTQLGYSVQKIGRPVPDRLGPENPIVDEFGNDNPNYNFQMHAVRQVEKHGRGILQVATGGGKSKIAKLLIARFRRPTLFLTTRGVLMYQMADHIQSAGMRCGMIGDGEWTPHPKGINCGMVQTFVARLKEPDLNEEARSIIASNIQNKVDMKKEKVQELAAARVAEKYRTRKETIEFLEAIEVVIGEEAHEAGGNSYFEILRHCKNANVRVALTATPFMRDDVESNMRLMAAFGQILIKVSEKLLIDRGILATPYFKFHVSDPHPKLRKTSPWQRAYQLGYVDNEFMIKDILRYSLMAKKHRLPILCLVQRKKHGEKLEILMNKLKIKAVFLQGENNQTERRKALNALRIGQIDCIIGTTILDVGVDVPAIGMIMLAGGGKAEIALRQRIGRGLRSKKDMPNVCFVVDFTTTNNSHLRDHAYQRRQIIEGTPGFAEGIIPEGRDFDWSMLSTSIPA